MRQLKARSAELHHQVHPFPQNTAERFRYDTRVLLEAVPLQRTNFNERLHCLLPHLPAW